MTPAYLTGFVLGCIVGTVIALLLVRFKPVSDVLWYWRQWRMIADAKARAQLWLYLLWAAFVAGLIVVIVWGFMLF